MMRAFSSSKSVFAVAPFASLVALLAALLAVAPAAAQVSIDDFSTAQAALTVTVPPDAVGDTASSSVASAGSLGGTRDLLLTFKSGGGGGESVSAEVVAGTLTFTADSGASGELLAVWDGDSDPNNVDPVGLGGVDLTASNAGAVELLINSASAGAQVEVEIYTDADNRSRASQVLSAIAVPTGVFIDFSELTQSTGATGPADLTNVGAVTVRLLAEDGQIEVELIRAAPPQIAAAQADFTAAGTPIGGGSVEPGDTMRYRITISNPGGGGENLNLADVLDPNLVVVGTVRTTPIPRGDQYSGLGNVSLSVDGVSQPSLLANDSDPDSDPVSIVAAAGQATSQGGSVDIAADGTFDYAPPAGFTGIDSFTYTLSSVAGDPTADASDNPIGPITGTATITIDRTVWFVDNTHGGPFEGTQANPFNVFKDAEAASGENDIIRIREGDGTDTGHDQGFILKPGQRLVGGAADLIIGGTLIEAGTSHSVHSHAAGNVLDLAGDHVIEGMRLNPTTGHGIAGTGSSNITADDLIIATSGAAGGVSLTNHSGSFTFSNGMISSTASTTGVAVQVTGGSGLFDFSGSPVSHDGGGLIHVQNTTGGATVDFTGSNPSLANGSDHGILLSNNAGGASFTFDTIGDVGTGSGHGVRVANSGTFTVASIGNVSATGGAALDVSGTTVVKGGAPGALPVSSLASTGGAVGVNLNGVAPAVTVGGTTTVNGATGVNLQSSGAATFTGQVGVTSTAGAGITAANTGLVSIPTASSTVSATGGPGLDVTNTALAMTFASVSAAPGAGGPGVSLIGTSGTLTANGGTITGGTAGTAYHVDGGSPTVTHGGTVTQNNAQRVVNIEDTTGGAVSFTANVTGGANSTGVRIHNADGNGSFADLDLGTSGSPMTNTALTLSGGSTGTFGFAGTQIFTTGATGIDANNGGTVEVTGAGNRVTATTGIAVQMMGGTTIGANGATFERIDASGSTHGIRLSSAGSGFTVTGSGSTDGSGGVIQSVTQRGIEILSTHTISLANMTLTNASTTDAASDCTNLVNTGCHAPIHLATVTGVTLDNVDINGSTQQGLNGVAVSGFSLMSSTILNAGDEVNEGGLRIINLSGTSQVTASEIGVVSERAALIENTSAPNLNLTVSGSTFRDTSGTLGADGLEMAFFGTSTATLDVSTSNFLRNRTNGIQVIAEDTAVVGIDVTGSTFMPQPGSGIGMDLATADSGSLTFNVIGNPQIYADEGTAVNIFAIDTGTVQGRVNNNPDIRLGGAASAGIGVRVQVNEDSRGIVEISGNTISQVGFDAGIQVISRLKAGAACGTTCTAGRLDATVNNNNVTIDSGGLYDVWVQANDSNTTCANVTNNTGSGAGIAAFRQRTNAAASTVLLQGFNTDATTTWNNNGNTPAGSVSSSNNGTLSGGTCTTVSHPLP